MAVNPVLCLEGKDLSDLPVYSVSRHFWLCFFLKLDANCCYLFGNPLVEDHTINSSSDCQPPVFACQLSLFAETLIQPCYYLTANWNNTDIDRQTQTGLFSLCHFYKDSLNRLLTESEAQNIPHLSDPWLVCLGSKRCQQQHFELDWASLMSYRKIWSHKRDTYCIFYTRDGK